MSLSEKRVVLSELRMKAVNSNSPPRCIIRGVTAKVDIATAVQLPNYNTLSRNVRCIRSRANALPAIPKTLTELVLTERFCKTVKGDDFVLFDNKDGINRIVMFGTRENLIFLKHCDDWYMDGTFDISPPLFKQVYTIHGK